MEPHLSKPVGFEKQNVVTWRSTVARVVKVSIICTVAPYLKDDTLPRNKQSGVCQGQSSAQLGRELSLSRTTATEVRHQLQAKAEQAQAQNLLDDLEVETDEMFQNAGEKK